KSYVFVISTDEPDLVKKRFEISLPPWLNLPELLWSHDGKFLAVNFHEYQYDQAFLLNIESGDQRLLHKKMCDVKGVLTGPETVLECRDAKLSKKYIRFLGLDESVKREFEIPYLAY